MPLLIVRPQPGAARTAEAARALGLDPVVAPLFAVRALNWVLPDGSYDAILATSANAFLHGGPRLARLTALPVHAVGTATADAARAAGFTVAITGQSDAEGLLRDIPADTRLLWIAGSDHRPLSRTGMTTVIVYGADVQPLDPEVADRLSSGGVVALHSPRAGEMARSEFDRIGLSRAKLAVAALSRAVADAAGDGWGRVGIASRPTDAALLSVAASLCKTGRCNDDLPAGGDGRKSS